MRSAWIIDSTPAAVPEPRGSAWGMLGILRSLPDRFASRDELVDMLVERGVIRPIAMWMATNLERTGKGTGDEAASADGAASADVAYRWRFDLDAMEALLRDFFRTDLWDVVEAPPPGCRIHFVKASESSILDDETVARMEAAASSGAAVDVHVVEGGHWLNADNPDALVELLAGGL